jgi:hypothetical protein
VIDALGDVVNVSKRITAVVDRFLAIRSSA